MIVGTEVNRRWGECIPEMIKACGIGTYPVVNSLLWVGEGDLSTPAFISDAAARSLAAGETFYTWQRGIPELREALSRYYGRHFGKTFQPEEFLVTGSGMQSVPGRSRAA
mgnify:CR=1 FL=1